MKKSERLKQEKSGEMGILKDSDTNPLASTGKSNKSGTKKPETEAALGSILFVKEDLEDNSATQ